MVPGDEEEEQWGRVGARKVSRGSSFSGLIGGSGKKTNRKREQDDNEEEEGNVLHISNIYPDKMDK